MKREAVAEEFHRAALRLLRRLRNEDTSFQISTARLSALSVLVFVGPQSVSALAEIEQVSQPTMTSLTQGLAKDELIRIERDVSDRRIRRLVATRRGKGLLQRARRRRIEALSTLMDDLTERELGTLARAAKLVGSMLEDER